jgi:hypothetical protein
MRQQILAELSRPVSSGVLEDNKSNRVSGVHDDDEDDDDDDVDPRRGDSDDEDDDTNDKLGANRQNKLT